MARPVNTINGGLSEKATEFIDGELLGDGSLNRNAGSPGAQYAHSTSREDYRDWLADVFADFGLEVRKRTDQNERGDVTDTNYRLRTPIYTELGKVHQRWYPNGSKVVPANVSMSPVLLRQWYIGDGCRSERHNGYVTVVLSTQSFSAEEQEILVEKLSDVGIEATSGRNDGRMTIRSRSHGRFFEYMAALPPRLEEIYGYKWP